MKKLVTLCFALALFQAAFIGCAADNTEDDGSSDQLLAADGSDTGGEGTALTTDLAVPDLTAPADLELSANPVAATEIFGQEGNLYKPRGDDHGAGPGNLVVLLSPKFTEEFDSCEAVLNTGETRQLICINDQPWTHTPFSCFANGDRQHWRANFKCSDMAEVKVTCREEQQEVIFTVPEQFRHQVCSRFG